MTNFFTIITITLIFTTIFIATINVGEESYNNTILSDSSKTLIQNISYYQTNNLNEGDFEEGSSTLAENSSGTTGEDTFALEFFERQQDTQQQLSIVQRITKIPDLILISLGIPDSFVSPFKWIVFSLISIVISFATIRAIFGGGRVTDR
jgi:hypothetical protein